MAENPLSIPVSVASNRLTATMLPPGFSVAYRLHVLQQGQDIGAVADKANDAAAGADNALTENQQQNKQIATHDEEIKQSAQGLAAVSEIVHSIEEDYLSKSVTDAQTLASPLGVTESLSVDGVKVLGSQQTGWTASSGTPNKSAFDADQAFAVGEEYSQSEVKAIATALIEERQRSKALEDAMREHGLID